MSRKSETIMFSLENCINLDKEKLYPLMDEWNSLPDMLTATTAMGISTYPLPCGIDDILKDNLFAIDGIAPVGLVSERYAIFLNGSASKYSVWRKNNTVKIHSNFRPNNDENNKTGLYIYDSETEECVPLTRKNLPAVEFRMMPLHIQNHPEFLQKINSELCTVYEGRNDFIPDAHILDMNNESDAQDTKYFDNIIEIFMNNVRDYIDFMKEEDKTGFMVPMGTSDRMPGLSYFTYSSGSILFIDNDTQKTAAIICSGNRYVCESFRGKGYGTGLVLFSEENRAVSPWTRAVAYSKGGYETRVKAYEILEREALEASTPRPSSPTIAF